MSNQLPIFCRYTTEALGSCKVDLRISSVIPPANNANDISATISTGTLTPSSTTSATLSAPPNGSSNLNQTLESHIPIGSKINLSITIDHIRGLTSKDFKSIHLQARLTSFAGPSADIEDVFPSNAVDLNRSSSTDLKFRKTISFTMTNEVAQHMKHDYAPIE